MANQLIFEKVISELDLLNDKVDSLVAYTNKPKSDSEKIVALKKDISSEKSSKLLKDAYVKNITLKNEMSRLISTILSTSHLSRLTK